MTTNIELEEYAKKLNIKHFRGVYMRDTLPKKIRNNECGIVNLEDDSKDGSHWVAFYKKGELKIYFDSYGLDPPNEVKNYLGRDVLVSTFQIQQVGTSICGELCLYVLYILDKGHSFDDIILTIVNE